MVPTPALLSRFRDGDRAAFEEVFEEFNPLVVAVVARHFRSPFDQEDAVQEVWLQVYRNRRFIDPRKAREFPGWIRTVARNRALDLRPRRGPPQPLVDPPEAPGASPDRRAGVRQSLDRIREAADRAGRSVRDWFEASLDGSPDHAELARTLGITVRRSKYLKKLLLKAVLEDPRLRETLGDLVGEAPCP